MLRCLRWLDEASGDEEDSLLSEVGLARPVAQGVRLEPGQPGVRARVRSIGHCQGDV